MEYHVGKKGQTEGPLAEGEVASRLADGRLGPDDLVWAEGWDDWIPLRDSDFSNVDGDPPAHNGAHPWRRYLARMADINLFTLSFGIAAGVVFPEQTAQIPDIVLGVLSLACMIPVEALLLHHRGATPGKWLLGIRVADIDSRKLELLPCFRRALGVFVSGCGLGIPIVSLFTLLSSYQTLGKNERVSWDRSSGSYLRFRPIGRFSLAMAWILWFLTPAFVIFSHLF